MVHCFLVLSSPLSVELFYYIDPAHPKSIFFFFHLKLSMLVSLSLKAASLVASFANFSADGAPAAAAPKPKPAAAAAAAPKPVAAPVAAPAVSVAAGSRVFASPLARKTALAKGYDIRYVVFLLLCLYIYIYISK
jgi:hypothetical protein